MINLDGRTRLIIVAMISSVAVIIKDIFGLLMLLLLTIGYCIILSLPIYESLKKIKRFLYVFFFIIVIQSIFLKGGSPLISIGGLNILTTYGLLTGVSIILRMTIIIISALIIASAGTLNIVYGLIAMKLPYEIAYMVLISMKFLPLFREEFIDSIIAIQLAGVNIKKVPLRQKLSLYSYVLTPAVINSLKRARYISAAMECRGFRAYPDRTSYIKMKIEAIDYIAIFATFLLIGMIVFYII